MNHRVHPFNGPLSGTTWVSQYQKGKTNLDFTEARDSEWQSHQLARMQVCTSLQIDNHASTPLLNFLQAGCPSCRPANSVKALKASIVSYNVIIFDWSELFGIYVLTALFCHSHLSCSHLPIISAVYMYITNVNCTVPRADCRRGAHLPFLGCESVGGWTTEVWLTGSVTSDLWLPSQLQGITAADRYQIILLGDKRGMCEQLAQACDLKACAGVKPSTFIVASPTP